MTDHLAALIEDYQQRRAKLDFLDSNLWIGRPRFPEFATDFDLPTLRRRMERYAIRGGVVSHFASVLYGPTWGNGTVLEAIAGTGLWAAITMLPEWFYTEEAGQAYLTDAIARGARLARVFPMTHNFTLRGWCSGRMLRALADHHLPLVMWHTEVSWEDVRTICESYPELPVIVEGTPRKILYYSRLYYPLLERCPNLHLELHSMILYLEIDDLVSRFGARRLIFGSYMPVDDPNIPMMLVTHGRFSEEDKVRIAGQNLAEMISGVRNP